jgi:hypothetical protein
MLVLLAAALVAAGTLWRLAVVLPRDSRLDLPSGVWLTLATDFADGSFYRPLVSDIGLGGARYFPLHFVLHGALIKTGLDPIRAGYVVTLALAAVLSMVNALFVLRGDDLRPARAELTEVAALTGPPQRPLLAEINILPAMTGERPYLMDCYSFRVIALKRPDYAEHLWQALRMRRFRAVVLRTDPRTEAGRAWLREMNFGPGFAERLLADYRFLAEKHGCLIFVPQS